MLRYFLLMCLCSSCHSYGRTSYIQDKTGQPILALNDTKLFRYSDYYKTDIPAFEGTIQNISGLPLHLYEVSAYVHKKDGSVAVFSVCGGPGAYCQGGTLPINASKEVRYGFVEPWPFTKDNFESVEFEISSGYRPATEKDGYEVEGFLAKDEGCFKDYVSALSLEGIELRKKMSELLGYGCGSVIEKTTAAVALEKKVFVVGKKRVTGLSVLLCDEQEILGFEPSLSPKMERTGWVSTNAIVGTRKVIKAVDLKGSKSTERITSLEQLSSHP